MERSHDSDGEESTPATDEDRASSADPPSEELPVETPPGSPPIEALRAAAETTLSQRIVLDDEAFDSPVDPEGRWGVGALVRSIEGSASLTGERWR